MRRQRLNVFLLTDEVKSIEDGLDREKRKSLNEINVSLPGAPEGAFYHETPRSNSPSWLTYLQPVIEESPQLRISSLSAVLIVKASERYFALAYGHGRNLLNQSKIERRFGLKAALNLIDPDKLRILDTKTFENMVVSEGTQTSKSSELENFGVDAARDLLRAVTGKPASDAMGSTIAVAD